MSNPIATLVGEIASDVEGVASDSSAPVITYAQWTAQVQQQGGEPTVWPDQSSAYYGLFAARFDNATFTNLYNSGAVDATAPETISASGQFVYVLAPSSVQASGPHVMTPFQSAENAVFTNADQVATDIGLPSLASVEGFLMSTGRYVLYGALGLGALYAYSKVK